MLAKFKKSFFFLIFLFSAIFLLAFTPFPERQALGSNQLLMSASEEREALERELKQLEEKISQYEKDITKTQKEKRTLQNQISILKNKIKKLDLQIAQSNLMIKDVSAQIKSTEGSIEKTSGEIEVSKKKLTKLLRTIYEEDQKPFVEIFFGSSSLSDFFDNLIALETLNSKNQELLEQIKALKSSLESQKEALDSEKEDLERLLKIQYLQKKESEITKSEQEILLEKTKGRESEYQKILSQTKKRAAEIRARIFELIGVVKAPTFGEAVELAKYVQSITGVRPAFLLAVLYQESNIGKNVGQCYLKDFQTGEGERIRTGQIIPNVMKPDRDIQPFLNITRELGRDPSHTPVSCPMAFGWGGAMGPAQFLPSTWLNYKNKIEAITGRPADPWNIKDSFLGAALFLADYGAATQNPEAEWRAAMIYFSGTSNSKYRFYGDSVLKIASDFAKDIEAIEKLTIKF